MLAIQRKQEETPVLKVNLLPCKIHYDGPVEVEEKYWRPEVENDKNKAYFRGRGLEGNAVRVPEGYKGSIVRVTNNTIPAEHPHEAQDDDEDEVDHPIEETKVAEELATFDEVMVWDHDTPWDASEDAYSKGIDEWISFASAIHSTDDHTTSKPTETHS